MKIIDAHVHLGIPEHRKKKTDSLSFRLYNDYNSFLKCMDKSHIERAIILPIPHRDFSSELSNEYLLEASEKSSNRLIPFCRIDNNIEKNLRYGFKGAKLHLVYEDLEIKNLKQELKLLEEYNVPLLFHAKFKNKVQQVKEILKYAPNLSLILAHMGRGNINTDEGIVENAQALKRFDRVFFETSTVKNTTRKENSINTVCDIIGSKRIIFGTDYPFEKEKQDYDSRVSEFCNVIKNKNTLSDIMYNNIFYLLNLEGKELINIRPVKKSDFVHIEKFFGELSEEDKKFLAFSPKISYIKTVIKSERHCYIALKQNIIVGFMRESGRSNNYSLLEELVVHPEYRKMGIARNMLEYYHRIFMKTLAKTNAKNVNMMKLLKLYNYQAENLKAPRIINWSRNDER